MKIQRTTLMLPLALTLALFGACGVHVESSTTTSSDTPQAAAGSEEPLLAPADAAIPTEDEAAAAAKKTIDASNADAELEKLKKELEGGH